MFYINENCDFAMQNAKAKAVNSCMTVQQQKV